MVSWVLGDLSLPDPLPKFYRPSSPTSSWNPKREVLPPHFTDVETEAQTGAKGWTCVITQPSRQEAGQLFTVSLRDMKPLSWSAARWWSCSLIQG